MRWELRSRQTLLGNRLKPAYRRTVRELCGRRNLSINLSSGGKGLPDWVNTE